ncbi:hypothetical protein B4U80_05403, partial [Leptotrombidium deliense]
TGDNKPFQEPLCSIPLNR